MATKLPRLNIVLERPVLHELRKAAARDGVSASAKARDLIREALETAEDAYFSRVADARVKASGGATLTHAHVWGKSHR